MNKLIIEGMEYSLEKTTSILHHFNTPMVQYQGNTYYGLAVIAKSEKPEQSNGWISVKDLLPKEGGRYWCYVEEFNDLGVSHYQWNCSYNEYEKTFSDHYLNGGNVTHWMPLPAAPKKAPTPEKNYKILEGQFKDVEPHLWQEEGSELKSCISEGCAIYSVKRLSDGEVFKLGDNVAATPAGKAAPITAIEIVGSTCRLYDNAFYVALGKAIKEPTRVPLFKTEDGVELFEGDECWCVSLVSNYSIDKTKARPEIFPAPSYFKYFSKIEFAADYAALNAHLLSYRDFCNYLPEHKKKEVFQKIVDKVIVPSHQ